MNTSLHTIIAHTLFLAVAFALIGLMCYHAHMVDVEYRQDMADFKANHLELIYPDGR